MCVYIYIYRERDYVYHRIVFSSTQSIVARYVYSQFCFIGEVSVYPNVYPKYSRNGTVSRGFPLTALIALGVFFSTVPLEHKSLHAQPFIVGELFRNYTHVSYTTSIVKKSMCAIRMYLWCLFVLPLLYHRKAITQQQCSGN